MNRGKHIITTAFEHSSVANTFKQLEEVFGFDVDYVSIDSKGHLDLKELESFNKRRYNSCFYNVCE